jgi:NtrC-family two-component system response regulator AlgB
VANPALVSDQLPVLVVDDERNIRTTLAVCLEGLGCAVDAVPSAAEALQAVRRKSYSLAFVDLRLGQDSGLNLISELLGQSPLLEIVIITAYASIETAVEAIRRGAKDYLPKPFTPQQIRHLVDRHRERLNLGRRIDALKERLATEVPGVELESQSPAMQAVLDLASRAAASDAPVLLRGESGTGKGVLARLIHDRSQRQGGPFVTVNCPTLSQELLASELFGHARGAFTGAVRDQAGRVEAAEGGTLFLDEIAEISTGLQAKLLRFIQEREFERVGENRTRKADVRLIAATNRDLDRDVAEGRFREDLLYRLNVLEVQLPPLRDRREDILLLAQSFLTFFARDAGRAAPELSPRAQAALLAYQWPGNVRELRNAIERAIILWPAPVLEAEALGARVAAAVPGSSSGPTGLGGDLSLDDLEREHIKRVLARTRTMEEAASILGIDTSTLWRKRKRYEST